jgi:hypothetical protein
LGPRILDRRVRAHEMSHRAGSDAVMIDPAAASTKWHREVSRDLDRFWLAVYNFLMLRACRDRLRGPG